MILVVSSGALVFILLSVIAMYISINIGVSTATVMISEVDDEYLLVDVSDLTPHQSMFGRYWVESIWNPKTGSLDIACMSTRSRLGKLGSVSNIQVRVKKSRIDEGVREFGVYTVSSNGERSLSAKFELR